MEKPTLSASEALVQAAWTAKQFMRQAIDMIDREFGAGFAKNHPEFISSLIQAQSRDFHTTSMMAATWNIGDAINGALSGVENQLDNHLDYIATMIGNITTCDNN